MSTVTDNTFSTLSGAVVGLENVSYSYSEEESQPEVCLVVTSPSVQCPICTNFTVMIETTDVTAGTLIKFLFQASK